MLGWAEPAGSLPLVGQMLPKGQPKELWKQSKETHLARGGGGTQQSWLAGNRTQAKHLWKGIV